MLVFKFLEREILYENVVLFCVSSAVNHHLEASRCSSDEDHGLPSISVYTRISAANFSTQGEGNFIPSISLWVNIERLQLKSGRSEVDGLRK